MLTRWKQISSKILFRNPWWTYRLDAFQIPNGIEGEYHCVHTEGSSMIVPVMPDGRILLVKQYRFLCDRESIEFPCGGVQPGRTYDEMAQRELEEETGYFSDRLTAIGEFNPFNGVTDEMCHVFVAQELRPGNAKPDSTEEFEILRCTTEEIEALMARGEIWDGMTLAAWQLARPHLTPSTDGV